MDTTSFLGTAENGNNMRVSSASAGGFRDLFEAAVSSSSSNPASPSREHRKGKGGGGTSSSLYVPSSIPLIVNYDTTMEQQNSSLPDLYNNPSRGYNNRQNNGYGYGNNGNVQQLLLSDGGRTAPGNNTNNFNDANDGGGGSGGFVLRGGFRMPRPTT